MTQADWDRGQYERAKRNFIESRLRWRSVYLHISLIFTITWGAGWLWSWALLKLGIGNMPLRYAISFFVSYLVFIACVRVWADFIRSERDISIDASGGFDLPIADFDGGCAVALVVLALGLVVAALFALLGGLPLLMEVAFEVVFAGVVVRRLSQQDVVGNWLAALVRNTWLHALGVLVVLVVIAALAQLAAPQAKTFAQAIRSLAQRP